jgi:tyrosine-protein phosphatase YwqE
MIDIHSHILPNIDDGAPDIDTALMLCKGLLQLGFKGVIATPHIISDVYPNTEESIIASYQILKQSLLKNNIKLALGVAAEYLLDETVVSKMDKNIQLLTFPNKGLLLEFSYSHEPENITEFTFPILIKEYSMVLAHPERYSYWHGKISQYELLKDMGFSFQMNALSLTNYYGKQVAETANVLLQNGMIDYIGTDIHHERHLKALLQHFGSSGLQDIIQTYQLKNKDFEID